MAEQGEIKSVDILFNNAFTCGKYAIAGTRGWCMEDGNDKKIIKREAGRLEASLKEAEKLGLEILVFFHYPPVYEDSRCNEILDVLKKHNSLSAYPCHANGLCNANFVTMQKHIKNIFAFRAIALISRLFI